MKAPAPRFDWRNPYAWPRKPVLSANVVSTSQPLAAQAGLQMLAAGGNAVDAILATAITLTLVEPVSNGIGSDAYAIVWDGRKMHALNASGRSPAAWTLDYFAGRKVPERGWDSVSVPGAVSAWVALHAKWGKLPFARLFEKAIEYGRKGFLVSPTIAGQWAAQMPLLKNQPGFADAFLPEGEPPRPGQRFKWKKHADVLEKIASTRGKAFYRGALAEKLEAHAEKHGGALRASDLAAHRCDWVKTLTMDYRGYTLHEIPPNGQGIVALMALGMLEHFDVRSHAVDEADSLHLQIEAMKLAFADARAYVADIDHMKAVPPASLLDKDYLKARARLIDAKRAQDFGAGKPPRSGTVYLAAADASGMMVSMIQSNYMGFGSGVVVDGISLQNRGATFVVEPGHPNCVGPSKRPYQTIIPGFVTRDGQPVMAFGVMGGTMQPQGHAQVLVRIADYGQNPQAACDGPRFRVVQGMDVSVERERFSAGVLEELQRRGHRIVTVDDYNQFGCAQLIWKLDGGYYSASDPRRDGQAVGF
jgi:gamma-glutamyltranspeptidase / glutathione hydrolase